MVKTTIILKFFAAEKLSSGFVITKKFEVR